MNAEPVEIDEDGDEDMLAVDVLEPLELADLLSTLPTSHMVIVVREGEAAFSIDFESGIDIESEPVAHRELQPGVGYLRLGEITTRGAEAMAAASEALDGAISLVLDLRDNPGGDLSALEAVAAWFLDGDLYLSEADESGDNEEAITSVDGKETLVPSVVLINRGTGGTAEILAAALSERGARLVGETTYGRDSIQTAVSLPDGTVIRMTTKHWLTPGGVSIAESGLSPDSEVSGRDEQLAAAIELVLASGAADSSSAATNGG